MRRWVWARTRAIAAVAGAATLATLATGAVLAACSSNEPAPAAEAPPRECPVSVASAIGAACREGQSCPIGYACGAFTQEATCTCTSGHFACTDSTGATLHAGDTPACVPNPAPGTCPAAESNLAPCAQAGLECTYEGLQCPETPSTRNLDTCTCSGNHDGGLEFHCTVSGCLPRADASDTLPDTGAPVDAAPPDSGTPVDSSPPDAAADDAG